MWLGPQNPQHLPITCATTRSKTEELFSLQLLIALHRVQLESRKHSKHPVYHSEPLVHQFARFSATYIAVSYLLLVVIFFNFRTLELISSPQKAE
jgi:hypothetical protein